MTMDAKTILKKARKILGTPEKWGKGEFEPKQGTYCVLGACRKAAGESTDSWGFATTDYEISPILERCVQSLHPRLAKNYKEDITQFNDRRATKHADIIAVLDCAIKCASEKP